MSDILYLQYDDDPGLRAVVLAGGINQTDNVEERGKQWPQIGIFHFLDVLEKSSDLKIFRWKINLKMNSKRLQV